MKYYNRDNYERNLESYEVPEYFTKGARNEFVYGFIVGAVIGSAVGLVSISKSRTTDKSIPEKDNQFKSSIIEQSELERQEAENKVNDIKSTVFDMLDKNTEATDAELSAQRVAIQQETSDNNLANMSPEAQEQQETEATEEFNQTADDLTHIDPNAEPKQSEINAQQNAIKEESVLNDSPDSIANTKHSKSNVATVGTAAAGTIVAGNLAKAANDKKQALNEDKQVSDNTSSLLSEEQTSGNSNNEIPNLITKSNKKDVSDTATAGTLTATGLALAAKNKNKSLNDNPTVAEQTANLLQPETPEQGNNKIVPSLVTTNVGNAVESTTDKVEQVENNKNDKKEKPEAAEQRVKQSHNQVVFNDGIIVHENASGENKPDTTRETKSSNTKNDRTIKHEASERSDNSTSTKQQDKNVTEGATETETTYSKNRSQTKKTEKAKSKIDKRTFND
ncbi:YtxH domain-containing protein [Staphylococcus edaphicus]|uniref:YtxH domain-containing protein n=1 Tax=Staphylococcus edaphicus TaxID=1955013 RepID=A0A2C6WSY4_9STAP|nr:YtxH domain-containing protein [Staphylococcus edaphicus]PHK50894.1 hypothetical protein BTJ66_00930 [Staphylococcus edaphicus]UQW82584.1 YtxH domain-containing protein [Staphylococcus edaphicus]